MRNGDRVTVLLPIVSRLVKAVVRQQSIPLGTARWCAWTIGPDSNYVRVLWPDMEGIQWARGHGADAAAALLLARSA